MTEKIGCPFHVRGLPRSEMRDGPVATFKWSLHAESGRRVMDSEQPLRFDRLHISDPAIEAVIAYIDFGKVTPVNMQHILDEAAGILPDDYLPLDTISQLFAIVNPAYEQVADDNISGFVSRTAHDNVFAPRTFLGALDWVCTNFSPHQAQEIIRTYSEYFHQIRQTVFPLAWTMYHQSQIGYDSPRLYNGVEQKIVPDNKNKILAVSFDTKMLRVDIPNEHGVLKDAFRYEYIRERSAKRISEILVMQEQLLHLTGQHQSDRSKQELTLASVILKDIDSGLDQLLRFPYLPSASTGVHADYQSRGREDVGACSIETWMQRLTIDNGNTDAESPEVWFTTRMNMLQLPSGFEVPIAPIVRCPIVRRALRPLNETDPHAPEYWPL